MEVLNNTRLSSRFILGNLFLLASAFLVVTSMTWSAGLVGLAAHEATTGKVVHQLVVHDGTTAEQRAAA
jgi:hypothetical protein